MLHVICTRLRTGHFSVRVGDSSRRSEETVRSLELRLAIIIIIIIIIIIVVVVVVVVVVVILLL